MRTACIAFSKNGSKVCKKIACFLEKRGVEVEACAIKRYAAQSDLSPLEESLRGWTERQFSLSDLVIFVGAVGIAVRSIAPFVRDKKTDPAVLVVDEKAKFVISLLSGHIGGANEYAEELAEFLQSIPVVTTATDLNQKIAVDVFAVKNEMAIKEMAMAKKIAADFLDEKKVGFLSDFPTEGEMPPELYRYSSEKAFLLESEGEKPEDGIHVTIRSGTKPFCHTLHLIPRVAALGIGCRKQTEKEKIERAVEHTLSELEIERECIAGVYSIDLKKEEEGLKQFCVQWNLPFTVFSKEQLERVPGDFTESEFVRQIAGVSNVCERSAVLGSGNGVLIQKKRAEDGVTVAVAVKDWRVKF
ncbi:MAG: cobalt-precorrin 5A hydrolase [Lachnospiraceae bacterium]|nr:cobalt-precorrin 5A hydrolase [Lachnospiraceae bacterium]